MICTCDACHYTFNASVISYSKYNIPKSCPDCGKKTIRTANGTVPAVRAATEEEIAEYKRFQLEVLDAMAAGMPSYMVDDTEEDMEEGMEEDMSEDTAEFPDD